MRHQSAGTAQCLVAFFVRKVGSLVEEVCIGSLQIFQRLLQRLRRGIGKPRVRSLPAWQQSAHARITEPLFFVFVALLVQRQGLVIDEAARAGKASQVAKLFAIRQGFELVALHPQHGSIVVAPWQDIKTFATADTLSSHCTYTWSSSQSIGIEYSMEPSRGFEGCSPTSLNPAECSDRRDLTWGLAIGKACSGRRLTSLLVAGGTCQL